jgi:hypothetical protein
MTQVPPQGGQNDGATPSSGAASSPSSNGSSTNDEGALTWKVARFGAVSALVGGLIGSIASAGIAWYGLERQEDARVRESEEAAYAAFLTAAQDVGSAAVRSRPTAEVVGTYGPELLEAQNQVVIYGSAEAMASSRAVVTAAGRVFEDFIAKDKVDMDTLNDYTQAVLEFGFAVRDALGVDD